MFLLAVYNACMSERNICTRIALIIFVVLHFQLSLAFAEREAEKPSKGQVAELSNASEVSAQKNTTHHTSVPSADSRPKSLDDRLKAIEFSVSKTSEWTGYMIGFWMTLCTLVVAGVGVLMPLFTMKKYEKSLIDRQKTDVKFLDLQMRWAQTDVKSQKLEYLNEMIALKPDLHQSYLRRADVLMQLKEEVSSESNANEFVVDDVKKRIINDYKKAILILETSQRRGEASKNELANAYCQRAKAEAKMSMIKNAIRTLEKAIEVDEDNAEAHYHLGAIYFNMDNFDFALKQWRNAIACSYDYELIHQMSAAGAYLILDSYESAIVLYDKACKANPHDIELLRTRAYAHIVKGLSERSRRIDPEDSFERAERYLLDILEMEPYYAKAKNNLGFLYICWKKYPEAEAYLKEAELSNPNFDLVYKNWGLLYFEKNEYENAIKYLEKALSKNPSLVSAYKMLGDIYFKCDIYKAKDNYTKAININRQYKAAYLKRSEVYEYLASVATSVDLVKEYEKKSQDDRQKAEELLAPEYL